MPAPPDPGNVSASASWCPLCGKTNECGLAAGQQTCWCMATPIPAAVLAEIPADARDRVCVCRACATKASAAAEPGPQ